MVSFVGVVIVIAGRASASSLTGSPVGFALTLGAAVCWARLHGGRGADPAAPLAARPDDLGARSAGRSSLASDRHRPAAAAGRDRPRGPRASRADRPRRSPTRGCSRRRSRTSWSSTASGSLGPTRVITIQALVPALRSSSPFVFLGEPIRIRPGRRRRDHRRRGGADARTPRGVASPGGPPHDRRIRRGPRSPAAGPAAAPRRAAAGDPRGLRRHDRADRRVRHGHGRVRPRRLGAGGRGATTPG